MKPGVSWPDMHGLAYRVVLERLTAAGVLTCVGFAACGLAPCRGV